MSARSDNATLVNPTFETVFMRNLGSFKLRYHLNEELFIRKKIVVAHKNGRGRQYEFEFIVEASACEYWNCVNWKLRGARSQIFTIDPISENIFQTLQVEIHRVMNIMRACLFEAKHPLQDAIRYGPRRAHIAGWLVMLANRCDQDSSFYCLPRDIAKIIAALVFTWSCVFGECEKCIRDVKNKKRSIAIIRPTGCIEYQHRFH